MAQLRICIIEYERKETKIETGGEKRGNELGEKRKRDVIEKDLQRVLYHERCT